MASKIWEAKQSELQAEAKRLYNLLEEKKREKIELARMRSRQEFIGDFEKASAACALEILDIQEKYRRLNEIKSASESFARLAQLQVFDLAHISGRLQNRITSSWFKIYSLRAVWSTRIKRAF